MDPSKKTTAGKAFLLKNLYLCGSAGDFCLGIIFTVSLNGKEIPIMSGNVKNIIH
jgi:hypothetical protein